MDDLINYDRVPKPNDAYRLTKPSRIDFFQRLDERGEFDLSEFERRWAQDYEYLLSHGYQLRPRFHPKWTPSWHGTGMSPLACEDSIKHFGSNVIDAKRIEDGRVVAIKRIPPYTREAEIGRMLSTPERLSDAMNHCVPISDYFQDHRTSSGWSFIVMPLLRDFDDPPFTYVDEVVDFVRQTLEGLVYLHRHDVAHRDLSDGNIMMEGHSLYGKEGFHPSYHRVTAADVMIPAKPRTRKDVGFVKYYFIDFGLSTYFEDPSRPRLVSGKRAQDRDVPELSDRIPYDPFAVDIFTLGMVFKRNFLDKYSNMEFLSPLCSSMTEHVPSRRPTAPDALASFQKTLSACRGTALRWRLRTHQEAFSQRIAGEFRSAFREIIFRIKPPVYFLLSVIRATVLFPVKIISVVLYYGPRRLIAYFQRSLESPESQPLLT